MVTGAATRVYVDRPTERLFLSLGLKTDRVADIFKAAKLATESLVIWFSKDSTADHAECVFGHDGEWWAINGYSPDEWRRYDPEDVIAWLTKDNREVKLLSVSDPSVTYHLVEVGLPDTDGGPVLYDEVADIKWEADNEEVQSA